MSSENPFYQENEELFISPDKIYPAAVKGFFRRIKWLILFVTLGVYYFLPFSRWNRGNGLPDQAILLDFDHQRLYFFSVELWPQDLIYITGILIIASFTLFLVNSVAGRVWCGYLCPQTVWTDLFRVVERFFQGERREQMRRDAAPLGFDRAWRKAATWLIWLTIGVGTGGAWVLYFVDAPSLMRQLIAFDAPFLAYVWIGVLTATTFLLAGFYREQVCLWMCPWPRIQAALIDEWALNVSYRVDRGEPRGSLKHNEKLRAEGEKAGDCVDCGQCVAVCPTGVDIRQGLQMGCIQCGLCIDACDNVMTKIGRPTRLIAYDTDINIERRAAGLPELFKWIRPRTVIYALLIVAVSSAMMWSYLNRVSVGVDVYHDRNPQYVTLADGAIRNGFTLRLLNKQASAQKLRLDVEGLPAAAQISAQGLADGALAPLDFALDADQTREVRLFVTLPPGEIAPGSTPIRFRVSVAGEDAGASFERADHFVAP